jgi:hypothetical protein
MKERSLRLCHRNLLGYRRRQLPLTVLASSHRPLALKAARELKILIFVGQLRDCRLLADFNSTERAGYRFSSSRCIRFSLFLMDSISAIYKSCERYYLAAIFKTTLEPMQPHT